MLRRCRRSTRWQPFFPTAADVCACDHNFVCAQCAGTPFDPRYLEDEYEPMDERDFDGLIEHERTGEWV